MLGGGGAPFLSRSNLVPVHFKDQLVAFNKIEEGGEGVGTFR